MIEFFPIIAAVICQLPYGCDDIQQQWLNMIGDRALDHAGLQQTIHFFLRSNLDNQHIQRIWKPLATLLMTHNTVSNNNSPSIGLKQNINIESKSISNISARKLSHLTIPDNNARFGGKSRKGSGSGQEKSKLKSKLQSKHKSSIDIMRTHGSFDDSAIFDGNNSHRLAMKNRLYKSKSTFIYDDFHVDLYGNDDNDNDNDVDSDITRLIEDEKDLETEDNVNEISKRPNHKRDKDIRIQRQRRRTMSIFNNFNNLYENVAAFRWVLDNPIANGVVICNTNVLTSEQAEKLEFGNNINEKQKEHKKILRYIQSNPILCDPINGIPIGKILILKQFSSAARPVLIETYNISNEYIDRMILKKGDDLRQDCSIIYMFHIFNLIWQEYDCMYKNIAPIRALTYQCVAMEKDFGCIELVSDCISLADVNKIESKLSNNPDFVNEFISSAVGSYIAAYICGIGDRHFENVLICTNNCTLFHIDFGYVLGHRVAYLDTGEFAITNELYELMKKFNVWNDFVNACGDAFIILRNNYNEIIHFAKLAFCFFDNENNVNIEKYFENIFLMNDNLNGNNNRNRNSIASMSGTLSPKRKESRQNMTKNCGDNDNGITSDEDIKQEICSLITSAPSDIRTKLKNTSHNLMQWYINGWK